MPDDKRYLYSSLPDFYFKTEINSSYDFSLSKRRDDEICRETLYSPSEIYLRECCKEFFLNWSTRKNSKIHLTEYLYRLKYCVDFERKKFYFTLQNELSGEGLYSRKSFEIALNDLKVLESKEINNSMSKISSLILSLGEDLEKSLELDYLIKPLKVQEKILDILDKEELVIFNTKHILKRNR